MNTPYPATAYLKGFLNTQGYESFQADLGIEVILELFSSNGLEKIFEQVAANEIEDENINRIFALKNAYLQTIDSVILFLQNKNPTLAHSIVSRNYLPEANRFDELDDLDLAFGSMGIHDKARHLATLYLEDLGDLIKHQLDPHFGFSRYAERLATSLSSFDEMNVALLVDNSLVSNVLVNILKEKINSFQPDIIGLSVPFPGNLFGALKCGQFIKKHFPEIKIILGGGYPNTELRELYDDRVFDYVDFISLDDGEAPLLFLLEHLEGKRELNNLKRVFSHRNGMVQYSNLATEKDIPQREVGTPDYGNLLLDKYLSVIEIVNPMHRLWSDGRWNKLTLAHGCYWGKCTFCDVTLDYIQRYEPVSAVLLCDRIETIIEQTGQTGFHFVDEAAPPALMRDLALEIIRRKLTVTWWTNIRFEKSFTLDLCRLLKASGCIAVSGGLEVASDRLLELIKKGVTVAQVAQVCDAFSEAGIMVHAYLMYGFPTQSEQETIDSLEMVRQLFLSGVIQSGFWHRFAMTAHSPVGLEPADYKVTTVGPEFEGFAKNDLEHDDPTGAQHELFSEGLKTSLFNYMNGVGFDFHLSDWFEHEVPETTIVDNYIESCISNVIEKDISPNAKVVWLHGLPKISYLKENQDTWMEFIFYLKNNELVFEVEEDLGKWLADIFPKLSIAENTPDTFLNLKQHFEDAGLGEFRHFMESEIWQGLKENGLLIL